MNFRIAIRSDLPQLKKVYTQIIEHMNQNQIEIWDEVYPCEFFLNDIGNNCLYILEEGQTIVSAYALCDVHEGAALVEWDKRYEKALYIDRFGVNVNYLRRGIGSIMLAKALAVAKERKYPYLRLFVVDINRPAIKLYQKNGFKRVDGIYDEIIDESLTLHEYGFERKIQL